VVFAETTNAAGAVLPSGNEAIYTNAFMGIQADVIYSYSISGFEQFVVLRQQPPAPANFGFNPETTVLEVLTEFFDPPAPGITPQQTAAGLDELLDFGVVKLGQGRAFAIGSEDNKVPVVKQWLQSEGRTVLVEQVPFQSVEPQLQSLPPASSGSASLEGSPDSVLRRVASHRLLPPPRLVRKNTTSLRLADAPPKAKGFVLDYDALTTQTNLTLQADTTYYVSGLVNIYGTLTCEGNTVIKYTNSPAASLATTNLVWGTGPYRPAVFTAMDDQTVGETISGSSGGPSGVYGGVALKFSGNYASTALVSNARFSYLSNAIAGLYQNVFQDVQFAYCKSVVNDNDDNFFLRNVLCLRCGGFQNITCVSCAINLEAENCTFDRSANFITDLGNSYMYLTNCILASLTNWQAQYFVTNSCAILTNDSGVFQTVGGGGYYLATNSLYHGAGTTNINSALLTDLAAKTTYPPFLYSNTAFSGGTFTPKVQRDGGTSNLDIGYHYDSLDYAFGGVTVTANLTFTPGTAVGWFELPGSGGPGYGIGLGNSVTNTFNGTPTAPCVFARYSTVQEGGTGLWQDKGWLAGIVSLNANPSQPPQAVATFTHFALLSSDPGNFRDYDNPMSLIVNDCEFWSGVDAGYGMSIYATNCLFDRHLVGAQCGCSPTVALRNCTLHGGNLYIQHWSGNNWPVWIENCAFDNTAMTMNDYSGGNTNITYCNYNAFLTNAALTSIVGAHSITNLTNFDWQMGALGSYYQLANSPLIRTGSVPATVVGLAHFTDQTNQVEEGTNIVSIGYAYPAQILIAGEPVTSLDVIQGNSATFSVNVTNTQVTFQWYFDGVAIAGATNSSLSITNFQPGQAGSYSVVISNQYGSVTSTAALLTVQNPLALPQVGANSLTIVSPNVLELDLVTADTNSAWDFATNLPSASNFQVTDNGQACTATVLGFKQWLLYSQYNGSDNRVEKCLYLQLTNSISADDGSVVQVQNSQTNLWPTNMQFVATNSPLRYSPAIHVNQDGYLSTYLDPSTNSINAPKKAKVGYYLGSAGELAVSLPLSFSLVSATTGAAVTSGQLVASPDLTTPTNTWSEYTNVLEADFSAVTAPGEYMLQVPGLGASLPFAITNAVAMKWTRTYALGLYHQRCGSGTNGYHVNDMPWTRFVHGDCHTAKAYIPNQDANYPNSACISYHDGVLETDTTNIDTSNPPQEATQLLDFDASLYQFSNTLQQTVSGGHHDAGDYSKYVINVATLIHLLVFGADNFPGASSLTNLGIPESGSGPSDILTEAKREADFLKEMQDADGGFFFLVYPEYSEYEQSTPDRGSLQIVYPKTTAVTAAAVAALADIGSSPAFRNQFPGVGDTYLQYASNGWRFLTNALATHSNSIYGNVAGYQQITSYGNDFGHDDEISWAAAAMYAATSNQQYYIFLRKWLPHPADDHNGYSFMLVSNFSQVPVSSTNLAVVKYLPNTQSTNDTSRTMEFRIYDYYGNMIDQLDTQIPHVADTSDPYDALGKLNALKIYFNQNPTNQYIPGVLTDVGQLVGLCHSTWWNDFWPLYASYGCAIRDYAFAVSSGRLSTNNIDTNYYSECTNILIQAANDWLNWSAQNAYGTSLPQATKQNGQPGWYFSTDAAFEMAVANRIQFSSNYITAILQNFNYQHGANPVNMTFVTGNGWRRQRQIVNQYANYPNYDTRFLPPSGVLLGNMAWEDYQQGYLSSLFYPLAGDNYGPSSFHLYDRWGDYHNIAAEFVCPNAARALVVSAYLSSLSPSPQQAWNPTNDAATITFVNGTPALNMTPVVQLTSALDLSDAQITWDVEGQPQLAFGQTFTLQARTNVGETLIEAEAVKPDGRRIFGRTYLEINDPINGGTTNAPDTNTVALYHFDDQSQFPLTIPDSAHGYNLTVGGGSPDLFTNNSWMKVLTNNESAARFGANGDEMQSSVTIPDSVVRPAGADGFTMEFWTYLKQLPYNGSALYLFRFAQGAPGNDNSEWSIYYSTMLASNPQFFGPGGQVVLNSTNWSAKMTPNTWHAVKVTVSTNGLTSVYIDDPIHPAATQSTSPSYSSSDWQLSLGNFVGCIDELRISNTVR